MKKNYKKFYKLTQPDGFDFYTGKTIDYANNIGKTVIAPHFNRKGQLCSNSFLHASNTPDKCFIGAKIPCRAFEVYGVPLISDNDKSGFKELYIKKELVCKNIFKWNYELACNPFDPFSIEVTKVAPQMIKDLKIYASILDRILDSSISDRIISASISASIYDNSIYDSIYDNIYANIISAGISDNILASIYDRILASIYAGIYDRISDRINDRINDSKYIYIGFIFKDVIKKWKYIEHKEGEYPFQSSVNLWNAGVIPTFDGKVWRLHNRKKIIYKISKEDLIK